MKTFKAQIKDSRELIAIYKVTVKGTFSKPKTQKVNKPSTPEGATTLTLNTPYLSTK